MKVYLILLTDIDNLEDYQAKSSLVVNGYPLYAVTNKKEYLNEFISTRDMNKFKVVTEKVEDEEEYYKFINDHLITQQELVRSSFPTTGEVNGYYTVVYAKVVCTVKESDEVEYDYDSYILDKVEDLAMSITDLMENKNTRVNIDVFYVVDNIKKFMMLFNDEIVKALEFLGFEDFMEDVMYQLDNVDSSEYNLWEDKLRVFCILYKNTFK